MRDGAHLRSISADGTCSVVQGQLPARRHRIMTENVASSVIAPELEVTVLGRELGVKDLGDLYRSAIE